MLGSIKKKCLLSFTPPYPFTFFLYFFNLLSLSLFLFLSLARNNRETVLGTDCRAKTTTIAVCRINSPFLGSLVDSDGLISADTLADTTVDTLVLITVAHRRDVVALSLHGLECTAADLTDVLETLALAVLDEAVVDLLEDLGALVDGRSANLHGRGTSEHELDNVVPGGHTTNTDDGNIRKLTGESGDPVDSDGTNGLTREPALAARTTEDGNLTLNVENHAGTKRVHQNEAIDTAGTELLGKMKKIVTMRRKLGKNGLLGKALDGSGVGTSLVKSGVVTRELVGINVLLHVGDKLLGILSVVAKRTNQRKLATNGVVTNLLIFTALAVPGLRRHVRPELDVKHALSLTMIRRSHARTSNLGSLNTDSLCYKTTTTVLSRGIQDSCITRWRTSSSENGGSEVHAQNLSLQKISVRHCF